MLSFDFFLLCTIAYTSDICNSQNIPDYRFLLEGEKNLIICMLLQFFPHSTVKQCRKDCPSYAIPGTKNQCCKAHIDKMAPTHSMAAWLYKTAFSQQPQLPAGYCFFLRSKSAAATANSGDFHSSGNC